MNKQMVDEFITKVVSIIKKEQKKFSKKQLEITKKYTTEEVSEAFKNIHSDILDADLPSVQKIKWDKENNIFSCYFTDGINYLVQAYDNDKLKIIDILIPCDCSESEETLGKCPMCEGHGELEEDGGILECPMCEGSGNCPSCDGTGAILLSEQELGIPTSNTPEEEPLQSETQLFDEIDFEHDNEEVSKMISQYLYELDQHYYSNYLNFKEIYNKYFAKDDISYPESFFPTYHTPIMDEFTEEDFVYYGTIEAGDDDLLLSVISTPDGYKIATMEVECTMAEHQPELHGEEAIQCPCSDETTDGKPNSECPDCHGTGVIVCPVCLGMGWIPLAPHTLTAEDIENPERYINGVKDMYDI